MGGRGYEGELERLEEKRTETGECIDERERRRTLPLHPLGSGSLGADFRALVFP